ncbi:MAG TPA: hypothetical protein VGQ57_17825, partial [Polyangiaceae bacterium]|nr:hypothetical protein [Polyangiaceae bacterium]
PKAFRSAHKDAEQEVGAVEGRIAHVTITVAGPDAEKAVVNMDKIDLPSAVVGIPMPVDPGSHLFYAHTERVKSNALTVTLRDAGSDSVNLVLPNPPPDAPLSSSATTGGTGSKEQGPGQDQPATTSGSHISGQRIAGYVTLGVGAVGVGVGSYFLVNMLHKRGDANDLFACNSDASCSPGTEEKVLALDGDADKERNKAIVSYSIGGAALVTGLVLLLTDSPSPAAPATGSGIHDVHVLAGLGSVGLSGRF